MTPSTIANVQRSWQQVLPIRDQAAALFYGRLFEIDPSAKALFRGDMVQQGRKLMDMIDVAVKGLNQVAALIPALQQMGQRHVKYGVTVEQYATVGAALLWTLQQGLGDAFTPEVSDSWAEVYGVLSSTMISGTSKN